MYSYDSKIKSVFESGPIMSYETSLYFPGMTIFVEVLKKRQTAQGTVFPLKSLDSSIPSNLARELPRMSERRSTEYSTRNI